MTVDRRLARDLYTAAAVGLLLVTSVLNSIVAVTIAVGLIAIGLVIFPAQSRVGLVAAVVAVAIAVAIVLIRTFV